MPLEEEREKTLAALRAELSDVVVWEGAQYREGPVILRT